jgi:hypothetical protein
LDIFEGTFGFCRLTINGVKLYFFVYIAKGLESWDIKYLKKLLRVELPTTTEIDITMNYCASNKEARDMFNDRPLTSTPDGILEIFFPLQNPTAFEYLRKNYMRYGKGRSGGQIDQEGLKEQIANCEVTTIIYS